MGHLSHQYLGEDKNGKHFSSLGGKAILDNGDLLCTPDLSGADIDMHCESTAYYTGKPVGNFKN